MVKEGSEPRIVQAMLFSDRGADKVCLFSAKGMLPFMLKSFTLLCTVKNWQLKSDKNYV